MFCPEGGATGKVVVLYHIGLSTWDHDCTQIMSQLDYNLCAKLTFCPEGGAGEKLMGCPKWKMFVLWGV